MFFEQNASNKRTNTHIPMTATLIASVLLALSPKDHVIAQASEESNSEIETNNVQKMYYSLLEDLTQTDEVREDIDLNEKLNLELTVDQVRAVQEQLILFIEENEIVLTDEMKKEVATIIELEELFSDYLKTSVSEDREVEEVIQDGESIEEEEILEVEAVEESEKEELEIVEESEEQPMTEELVNEKSKQTSTVQVATFSVNKSTGESVSYTVRPGDTLSKIARDHNVTTSHIADLNNIQNVNSIRVGQVLRIYGSKLENDSVDGLENLGKPMTKNQFIEFLGKHASVAAKEQNLYASVMIAQAALESGFGTSGLSSSPNHNLYGMKGRYEGQSVVMRTREYSTAKGWHYVNAHFKKYPSYLESLLDHSAYIRRGTSWAPNFYSGVWRENTTSYRDATYWLQGRYATDPTYASKLNAIIESYNLTRFDVVGDDDLVVKPPIDESRPDQDVKPSTGDKNPEKEDLSIYQVKRGDTLSHIASIYKMSVQELKELNNLKSDLILVGQSLKVNKKVTSVQPTPEPEEPVSPTPTPTPEKPSESNTSSYSVKRGDTLSGIALAYKTTVQELKELNNLKSDLILVGQSLKVKKDVASVKPTPTPEKPSGSNISSYSVKSGDTLSRIALAHKTTVQELKELNNLKSDLIFVGQKLQVKSSVVGSIPAPTPTKPVIQNTSSYSVKSGDTLSEIALAYKTTVGELKELNNLKSDLIYIGQQLKVSQKDKGSSHTNVQNYQIKAGDTLSAIAKRFNTTVQKLKETNKLKSDLIFVNQRLKV